MEKKNYCGQCSHYNKDERWCYEINNHRKPLDKACSTFQDRKAGKQNA